MSKISAGPVVPEIPGIEDLRPIGRGGFATVYRGWQPAFHRSVAVKVLDSGPGTPPLSRFQKELRALGSLSGHPHVVPVYDAGTVDSCPYLVMPYMSGGSLEERLRDGPLPAEEAIRLGFAIADALTTAHTIGMLHRDIKPSNILASAYGEPQLADFGIARFADSTTTNGRLTATVSYAAPEVLAGASATPASDIYSLGATLYTALQGSAPFVPREGEALISLAMRAMVETPADLRGAGVDPELAAVVARAMANDAAGRYPSAAALRDALKVVESRRPSVEPAGPPHLVPGRPVSKVVGGEEPAESDLGVATTAPSGEPLSRPPIRPALQRARRGRTRRLWVGVAAAVAACGLGGLVLVNRNTPARSPAAGPPSTATAAQSDTAPPPRSAVGSGGTQSKVAQSGQTVTPTPLDPSGGPTQTIAGYYALVNQHSLTESFGWLSPAYQHRLGFSYYQQFWNSISQVDVVNVNPGHDSATVTLHFVETNGRTSTENAAMTFIHDASGRLLIDTYRLV